jgi:hypothetical protein
MSERIRCPECARDNGMGRVQIVRQCVDVATGDVVRVDDPEVTNLFECACGFSEYAVGICESCKQPIWPSDNYDQWIDGVKIHSDGCPIVVAESSNA